SCTAGSVTSYRTIICESYASHLAVLLSFLWRQRWSGTLTRHIDGEYQRDDHQHIDADIQQILVKNLLGKVLGIGGGGPSRENSSSRSNDADIQKRLERDDMSLEEIDDGAEQLQEDDDQQQIVDQGEH